LIASVDNVVMFEHCCDQMTGAVNHRCDKHPDPFDCPDNLIDYSPKFREYGLIIHDGGTSSCRIRFCPWCGAQLPASLRDHWFEELDRLRIDPWEGNVPEEFQSDAWWKHRGV
jgi:hypothetical protein